MNTKPRTGSAATWKRRSDTRQTQSSKRWVSPCWYWPQATFFGDAIGDFAFKRTLRRGLLVSATAVVPGAILMLVALSVPLGKQGTFLVLLSAAAILIPFAAPNVTSSIHDITLPEVRSTALAMWSFVESTGAALAPLARGDDRRAFFPQERDLAHLRLHLGALRGRLLHSRTLCPARHPGEARSAQRKSPAGAEAVRGSRWSGGRVTSGP